MAKNLVLGLILALLTQIDVIRSYLIEEINRDELMNNNHKKLCRVKYIKGNMINNIVTKI